MSGGKRRRCQQPAPQPNCFHSWGTAGAGRPPLLLLQGIHWMLAAGTARFWLRSRASSWLLPLTHQRQAAHQKPDRVCLGHAFAGQRTSCACGVASPNSKGTPVLLQPGDACIPSRIDVHAAQNCRAHTRCSRDPAEACIEQGPRASVPALLQIQCTAPQHIPLT